MENTIQLAIVDDSKLVVQLLRDFLEVQEGIEVCHTSYGGNTFLEYLQDASTLPQVVLLDLKMKDGDGLETIPTLTSEYPSIRIIVLSSFYRPSFMGYMLKAGVHAFIPKETEKEELLRIIYEVAHKDHYFTSDQIKVLRNQVSGKVPQMHIHSKDDLSEREIEVLKLICQQFTAKEIAQKIFVSPKTVEAHKSNLLLKTGAKNTAGLIIYAVQHRIVIPEEMILLD
mgnify:CR=1 FL=1